MPARINSFRLTHRNPKAASVCRAVFFETRRTYSSQHPLMENGVLDIYWRRQVLRVASGFNLDQIWDTVRKNRLVLGENETAAIQRCMSPYLQYIK